jgi:hypothetical protein
MPDWFFYPAIVHACRNMPGVTVGLPQPAPAADNAQYAYLDKPTPFSATNSGVKAGAGPFIRRCALSLLKEQGVHKAQAAVS